MKYQLFTRSWRFDENGKRNGYTRKSIYGYAATTEEAREKCKKYNDNRTKAQQNKGHMMEFTSDY